MGGLAYIRRGMSCRNYVSFHGDCEAHWVALVASYAACILMKRALFFRIANLAAAFVLKLKTLHGVKRFFIKCVYGGLGWRQFRGSGILGCDAGLASTLPTVPIRGLALYASAVRTRTRIQGL